MQRRWWSGNSWRASCAWVRVNRAGRHIGGGVGKGKLVPSSVRPELVEGRQRKRRWPLVPLRVRQAQDERRFARSKHVVTPAKAGVQLPLTERRMPTPLRLRLTCGSPSLAPLPQAGGVGGGPPSGVGHSKSRHRHPRRFSPPMIGKPLAIGALGANTVRLPRLALGPTVVRTASFMMHGTQPFSPPAAGEGGQYQREL